MSQITLVTTDSAGRLISFNEGQYAVTVRRDTAGRPLVVRATGPGKTMQSEFRYSAAGALTGVVGNFESAVLATLINEATAGGAPAVVWGS